MELPSLGKDFLFVPRPADMIASQLALICNGSLGFQSQDPAARSGSNAVYALLSACYKEAAPCLGGMRRTAWTVKVHFWQSDCERCVVVFLALRSAEYPCR